MAFMSDVPTVDPESAPGLRIREAPASRLEQRDNRALQVRDSALGKEVRR
jgi:hypothetical protein